MKQSVNLIPLFNTYILYKKSPKLWLKKKKYIFNDKKKIYILLYRKLSTSWYTISMEHVICYIIQEHPTRFSFPYVVVLQYELYCTFHLLSCLWSSNSQQPPLWNKLFTNLDSNSNKMWERFSVTLEIHFLMLLFKKRTVLYIAFMINFFLNYLLY